MLPESSQQLDNDQIMRRVDELELTEIRRPSFDQLPHFNLEVDEVKNQIKDMDFEWFFNQNKVIEKHQLSKEDLQKCEDCAICCEPFLNDKQTHQHVYNEDINEKSDSEACQQLVQLYCSHIFHSVCIKNWLKLKPKCPMCRKGFRQEIYRKEIQSLHVNISRLNRIQLNLSQQRRKLQQKIRWLRRQISELKIQIADLERKITDLERKITDLERKITDLEKIRQEQDKKDLKKFERIVRRLCKRKNKSKNLYPHINTLSSFHLSDQEFRKTFINETFTGPPEQNNWC